MGKTHKNFRLLPRVSDTVTGGRQHVPPPGSSPGTLLVPEGSSPTVSTWYHFDEEHRAEGELALDIDLQSFVEERRKEFEGVFWIDVRGLEQVEWLKTIAGTFSLHPLAVEDIVHLPQRPMTAFYPDYVQFIARMVTPNEETGGYVFEQISLFWGDNFVLTFQETHDDVFDPVRRRLKLKGLVRKRGADYLAYALIDTIMDHHFLPLEQLGEKVEDLENEVFFHSKADHAKEIYAVRREFLMLRRSVWPQREALAAILRNDGDRISEQTIYHFRDCYDHSVQLLDSIELYREMAAGLLDIYLSSLSHRMNDVMKLLTVISTVFIPLSFLAGVYGMNFDHFPEIHYKYGYHLFWLVCFLVSAGLMFVFYRMGWLTRDTSWHPDDHES